MMAAWIQRNALMPKAIGPRLNAAAAVVAAALLAMPAIGMGHAPAPDHGCVAPARPANDQNDVLWQGFLDDVDAFRACISDYAAANREAASTHSDAANEATRAWNRFVRAELNVPEDYPWPPGEQDGGR